MDLATAHHLSTYLQSKRSAFIYSGEFPDDHVARLVVFGEAIGERGGPEPSRRGRLAYIMVEAYQNIVRHRAVLPPWLARGEGRSLFMVLAESTGYRVITCDPVTADRAPALRAALHDLQGLDTTALKGKALKQMGVEHDGERRGAGLGLIEMARRSGTELDHFLLGVGKEHSLFTLAVRLGRVPDGPRLLKDVGPVHGLVVQTDTIMTYAGMPAAAEQEAMLRVMEEGKKAGAIARCHLAACAALDNAGGTEGRWFVSLAREGDHFTVIAGRTLSSADAVRYQDRVRTVGQWDRSTVDHSYRQAMVDPGRAEVDVDTLDLVRTSVEPLQCAVHLSEGTAQVLLRAVV